MTETKSTPAKLNMAAVLSDMTLRTMIDGGKLWKAAGLSDLGLMPAIQQEEDEEIRFSAIAAVIAAKEGISLDDALDLPIDMGGDGSGE